MKIGSTFWGPPWSSVTSSDAALRRTLFRVVGHDLCATGHGTATLDRVEFVRGQRQECIGMSFDGKRIFDGKWKDE